eukprot:scaffold62753_cov24-Tisochrysis_lutea.AAC.2
MPLRVLSVHQSLQGALSAPAPPVHQRVAPATLRPHAASAALCAALTTAFNQPSRPYASTALAAATVSTVASTTIVNSSTHPN